MVELSIVTVYEKLNLLLLAAGWSQRHASERIGVPYSTLNYWCKTPDADPSISDCILISETFGITLEEFGNPKVPLPDRILNEAKKASLLKQKRLLRKRDRRSEQAGVAARVVARAKRRPQSRPRDSA